MRDEDEFHQFARARTPALYTAARLMCGDAHLAEDLVQETLAKVYLAWGKRSITQPATYAQTTLVRTFISSRRRRMSSERPISDLPETGDDGCTADAAAQRLDLEEALRTLSATDRAVLVARYYDDLAIEEIAEAMRKNPAAVRRQASRALAKLRTVLGGQPVVEGEKSC